MQLVKFKSAIRIGRLGQVFLGLGEVLARDARHVDMAAERLREGAGLEDGGTVIDLDQRVIIHRIGDRLAQIDIGRRTLRSEEHTSELQSLMRISYAVFCLK